MPARPRAPANFAFARGEIKRTAEFYRIPMSDERVDRLARIFRLLPRKEISPAVGFCLGSAHSFSFDRLPEKYLDIVERSLPLMRASAVERLRPGKRYSPRRAFLEDMAQVGQLRSAGSGEVAASGAEAYFFDLFSAFTSCIPHLWQEDRCMAAEYFLDSLEYRPDPALVRHLAAVLPHTPLDYHNVLMTDGVQHSSNFILDAPSRTRILAAVKTIPLRYQWAAFVHSLPRVLESFRLPKRIGYRRRARNLSERRLSPPAPSEGEDVASFLERHVRTARYYLRRSTRGMASRALVENLGLLPEPPRQGMPFGLLIPLLSRTDAHTAGGSEMLVRIDSARRATPKGRLVQAGSRPLAAVPTFVRIVPSGAFEAWKAVHDAIPPVTPWSKEPPIEPILSSARAGPSHVAVTTRWCGTSLAEFVERHPGWKTEVLRQRDRIHDLVRAGLPGRHVVEHGHIHDFNYFVRLEKVAGKNVPIVVLGDWDSAKLWTKREPPTLFVPKQ